MTREAFRGTCWLTWIELQMEGLWCTTGWFSPWGTEPPRCWKCCSCAQTSCTCQRCATHKKRDKWRERRAINREIKRSCWAGSRWGRVSSRTREIATVWRRGNGRKGEDFNKSRALARQGIKYRGYDAMYCDLRYFLSRCVRLHRGWRVKRFKIWCNTSI